MADLVALGERMQTARRRAGKTLRNLQDETGVAYALISRIEKGQRPQVALQTVCRIADALGCSLDELAGRGSTAC